MCIQRCIVIVQTALSILVLSRALLFQILIVSGLMPHRRAKVIVHERMLFNVNKPILMNTIVKALKVVSGHTVIKSVRIIVAMIHYIVVYLQVL